MTPPYRLWRNRANKQGSQVFPVNFRAIADRVAGTVEQNTTFLVDHAFCIFTRRDKINEGVTELRSFQSDLAVMLMDIEQPALSSCYRG